MEESEVCQMCGTAQWKWDEDQYAYEIQERFCKGCYLKDISSEKADNLPGTTIRLIPAEEAERIRDLRVTDAAR